MVEDTLRNNSHGGIITGISPTKVSDTSATSFTCPQRSYPPPSRDSLGLMPDQVPLPEAVVSATNPQMVTVLLTGGHLALPMAIRLELLDLDPLPWNSEEDSVEARQNKFIMSQFKNGLIKKNQKNLQ